MPKWIAKAVGIMHIHKIKQTQLAEKMGVTREYVGKILNYKVSPPDIEKRVMTAINELIAEKEANNHD